ncbi:hypothetical protein [Nostoc sp. KVJ20]|uniref:hypothetical protein n=1 Tax=Nostoc sp. KVJ20 TaxID=457944 RepID=UPI001C4071D7|nr:hypothetical protein [Nostoc sp. KVJ20]
MSNFPSVKAKDFVKVIEKLGFHLVGWASRHWCQLNAKPLTKRAYHHDLRYPTLTLPL